VGLLKEREREREREREEEEEEEERRHIIKSHMWGLYNKVAMT